jgi:hypothetical protein
MTKAIWRSWTPEAVKRQVLDDLVANGEIAGKFIESDARSKLLGIGEPAWGAGYRRYIANYLLTSLVEREANAVVIWLGVKLGPKGSQHGLWIELGTATIPPRGGKRGRPGYPAHPYLRPAVFNNAREIVRLLAGR